MKRVLFGLLLGILLVACGGQEVSSDVAETPLPTERATAESKATVTAEATGVATAEATSTLAPESTPSFTPTSTATVTVLPATATATSVIPADTPESTVVASEPTAPSGGTADGRPLLVDIDHTTDDQLARGDYIRVSGVLNKPSDDLVLQWRLAGVSTVNFHYVPSNYGPGGMDVTRGGRGEMSFNHDPAQGGAYAMYVITTDTGYSTEFGFTLPCEYTWHAMWADGISACPITDWEMAAFFQRFENGFMVWMAGNNVVSARVFATDWTGTTTFELPDTFMHGVDPISDAELVPPAGLHQPEYGVGKVWRENPEVRAVLGWATDRGVNYTAVWQSPLSSKAGFLDYISLPGGGYIERQHPTPYWRIAWP